jgi:hypothetical protein
VQTDGIFEVIVVGRGGRACTAAGLPHGWQYVRYVAVGPTGSAELDRDEVTPWAVDNARNRKTLFVGRREQPDVLHLGIVLLSFPRAVLNELQYRAHEVSASG